MDSPSRNRSQATPSPLVPGWAEPRGPVSDETDAAFMAGAALNSLDNLVKSAPPVAGCWRKRQALACSLAALQLMNRQVSEQDLRDALLMVEAADEPGPAGAILVSFRKLTRRTPQISTAFLRELAPGLGVGGEEGLSGIASLVDDTRQHRRTLPFLVSGLVREVVTLRPDGEILAWWLADWLIAEGLGWEKPLPLLMAARHGPAFRTGSGKGRVGIGGAGFSRAVALAIASASADACRSAAELSRRAERLIDALPKLRSKGAEAVVGRLLDEDCLLATQPGPALSRWAATRLFERLQSFGAVRELSGRASFKVYGL